MALVQPIEIKVHEQDILLAILEFLDNRKLHISQVSLERESGLINGKYSEDVLFLRQLIIDGQWDNALDFAEPLKESPEFDQRAFCYLITKYKYFELLCIKQEPGPLHDNDFAVEEIVECLKDLEQISPTTEDYRQLCALLTLPKLSDHAEFKGWNPSAARVECFQKIYPLIEGLLENINPKKENQPDSFSSNDRLIQLVVKGIFYEACVDYCQAQALGNQKVMEKGPHFTKVLSQKPGLSAIDLSLISWLEVLPNAQFTIPFQQRSLSFKFDQLNKPKLDAQWSDTIMATPVKPAGRFPHSMVPNAKLRFAEKMSNSMIVPKMSASFAMIESTVSNRFRKLVTTDQMSQSTAPTIGAFMIANEGGENLMKQSQIISKMMENSELTKQSRPNAFDCNSKETSGSKAVAHAAVANVSLPPQLVQELSQSRRELDSITQQTQLQSSVPFTNSTRPPKVAPPSALTPVPELSTPGTSTVSPASTPFNDIMTHSRLFQEFANKKQVQQTLPALPVQQQQHYPGVHPAQMSIPHENYEQSMLRMQIASQSLPIRPCSALPGQVLGYYDQAFGGQPLHPLPQIPRPQSYFGSPSFQQPPQVVQPYPTMTRTPLNQSPSRPVQFVPLCRYEDTQAIRAVAFHPSGQYFAVGTNSKQLLVCKYPNIRNTNLNAQHLPIQPDISLCRPKQHRGSVYCCAFNASGELLATGSNDKTIRLMSFNENCKIGSELELNMHDGTIRDIIFVEDALVSAGAGNCQICLTDSAGTTFKNFSGHTAPILGLYSWDYKSFASCSQDKTIRFWDMRASTAVNVILPSMRTSNSPVTSVCIDPSGKLLVSGHEDASVMLFDLVGGRTIQIFRPHGDEVRTVRFSNAAFYLLSGSYDKRLIITDMRGDLMQPLSYLPVAEHTDKIIQSRWHPHDFTFLSSSADKTVVLWTLPS